jgi:two-component system, sensor histidine kinase and response regulator
LEDQTDETVTIKISVKDTGIGISPEGQKILFQPFSQADGSTTRRYGGTGLGLAISKKLVQLMSGEIGFTSKAGKGSTFTFSFRPKKVKTLSIPGAKSRFLTLEGLKVLVVDDNKSHCEIINRYLSSWRMNSRAATDGTSAFLLFKDAEDHDEPFNIAIIDYQMPDINGFDLVKRCSSISRTKGTKYILLTAFEQRGLSDMAFKSGFSTYLTKPLRQSVLFDAIASLTAKDSHGNLGQATAKEVDKILMKSEQTEEINTETVLLVEDNLANQKLASVQLKKLGYFVDIADNGKNAVEILEKDTGKYSFVLMDGQMPEMDGYTATREIRVAEKKTGTHVPIIAMTASAMEGDRQICIDAGMDEYISKPVTIRALQETIKRVKQMYDMQPIPMIIEDVKMNTKLNKDILENIRDLQNEGEADFLTEMIDVYKKESRKTIKQIDENYQKKNLIDLKKAVHSLKGSSSNLGATELSSICHELEIEVEKNDWDVIGKVILHLKEVYDQTISAMDNERK